MKKPNQNKRSRFLFLAMPILALVVSSSFAGDLAYNLKPWGYDDARIRPWKYKPGEAVHEFVNGKLQFFIITDVEWDKASNDWKYKKLPDFRMKL